MPVEVNPNAPPLDAGQPPSERLTALRQRVAAAERRFGPGVPPVELIAVSKTVSAEGIVPFLAAGQRHFGENRVQEAAAKWPLLRARFPGVTLHMLGPLQTNKAREALGLFDVIHTLDRDKLAGVLAGEMARVDKHIPCFVEVNIGGENQKAGVAPSDTAAFVERCRAVHGLTIVGLMCVPPADKPPAPYFAHLVTLSRAAGAPLLSMGMSADFETAIMLGASHVRVGTALFGPRA